MNVAGTPPGFYQVADQGAGDVIGMAVSNCTPPNLVITRGPTPGTFIQLIDANFITNTLTTLGAAPLDTSNQQLLLEVPTLRGVPRFSGRMPT